MTIAQNRPRGHTPGQKPPFDPEEQERLAKHQYEQNQSHDEMDRAWESPPGLYGNLSTVQNGPIVNRFLTVAFILFCLAGLEALVIRTQLWRPLNDFVSPSTYNQMFTMHGSTMMFLVTVPMMEAFAAFAMPPLLGAREMPFPKMTAFGMWTFMLGSAVFYSSFLFGDVPEGGWYAYVPLTGEQYSPGRAIDFWLLGLSVAEVAAIATGIEIITGILKMRAPGMTLYRMPVYIWAVLVMAYSLLFGFTPLIVGTSLLELDRKFGFHYFNPAAGGDPVLWQHIFWMFGHPDVYIQFIPGAGIVSMVVAAFARRPLVGQTLVVLSLLATGFISFGLWVHHMYTTGLPLLGLNFFALASLTIAIPSGIQVFSWIATIWTGKPVYTTAFLFALGTLFVFVIGGVTGVMVAVVPYDWQVHDSYFLIAHFHYVLIGGVILPIFAAFYYWLPKQTGTYLSETLGKWNFWLTFIGFNVAFFPMHITGLMGMPRRYYTYLPGLGWELPNQISTVGAYILGLGIAIFVWNAFWNVFLGKGQKAPDNAWDAGSLEWATTTPPPNTGYRIIPIVRSRYPMWQQDTLERGPEHHERVVHGMAHSPSKWRAQVITTAFDAEPQAIVKISGSSIIPLIAALILTGNFIATIFDNYFLLTASFVGTVGITIVWLWPPKDEREFMMLGNPNETHIHGLPVYTSGTNAIGWWGMVHVALVSAIASAVFIFSYFYIRSSAVEWPLGHIPPPEWTLPLINTVILLASGPPMYLAYRSIRRGNRGGFLMGFGLAFLLGAAFLFVQIVEWVLLPFTPQDNAYGSAFFGVSGYHAILVAIALTMNAVVQVQGWLGYFNHFRFLAVQTVTLYWAVVIVNWLVTLAVLYVSPYLI